MENIKPKPFLKRLSEEQLKELIMLCGKKENISEFKKIPSLDYINLQLPTKKEEWDLGEYLYINAHIGQDLLLFQEYQLNDFEMLECSGYSKVKYNELLREYLTIQFGEEYIEYLFNKHVSDATEEKETLTIYYQEHKEELLTSNKVYRKSTFNK